MQTAPNNLSIRIRKKTSSIELYMKYLEQSISKGISWAVFERNDESLWSRIRDEISNFLTLVWRSRNLQGSTPGQAFFVRCDRTTMTQDDIDLGRLICVVGVALVKPAEFRNIPIIQQTR